VNKDFVALVDLLGKVSHYPLTPQPEYVLGADLDRMPIFFDLVARIARTCVRK
jgi:hypothetical protein